MRLALPAVIALLAACASEAPPPPAAPPTPPAVVEAAPAPSVAPTAAPTRLDLNTASADALGALPGMTPKLAGEVEEYRPYVSIQQFRKSLGKYVDAAQVTAWEPLVYVPIDANNSDAETLRQVPGLDAAAADKLIAGRPYAGADAFVSALEAHVGAEQAAQARSLLVGT